MNVTLVDFGAEERISNFKNRTGYNKTELAVIELLFIRGIKKTGEPRRFENNITPFNIVCCPKLKIKQKELQFKGMCAVIEYLCELDNVPNVMEIKSLFEYDNDAPEKQLLEVL